jgi:hypothetical protein
MGDNSVFKKTTQPHVVPSMLLCHLSSPVQLLSEVRQSQARGPGKHVTGSLFPLHMPGDYPRETDLAVPSVSWKMLPS